MIKIRHFGVENYKTLPKPNNSLHNSIMLEPITAELDDEKEWDKYAEQHFWNGNVPDFSKRNRHEVLATIFALVFIVGILAFGLYLIH